MIYKLLYEPDSGPCEPAVSYFSVKIFSVFLLLLPLMVYGEELTQTSEGPKIVQTSATYTFGVVPQFQHRRILKIWRPILDEIEKKTDIKFTLTGTPTIPAFEKKFMRGDLDFAYMNPYHILVAAKNPGYIPLVRDGNRKVRGILVTHVDSPIKNIKELAGKLVAFPAPNALGASLLVRADLDRVFGISVKPKYAQTHSSVYLHVAKKLVAAGGGVISTFLAQKKEIRDQLKIIYTTQPVITHPITVHPRVPKHHIKRVRDAFLELGTTEAGRKLLSKIPMERIVPTSNEEYLSLEKWGLEKYYERNKHTER